MYVIENYEIVLLPVLDEEDESETLADPSEAGEPEDEPTHRASPKSLSGMDKDGGCPEGSNHGDVNDLVDPDKIFAELSASLVEHGDQRHHASASAEDVKHDLVVTFSYAEWPKVIAASNSNHASNKGAEIVGDSDFDSLNTAQSPCLDAEIRQLSVLLKHPKLLPPALRQADFASQTDNVLLVNCPANGRIEQVMFINFPDEVCPLLKGINSLILACLNEQGVKWEQTVPL